MYNVIKLLGEIHLWPIRTRHIILRLVAKCMIHKRKN